MCDMDKHCKHCLTCRKVNTRPFRYPLLHLMVLTMPMHSLSMDLIGPFKTTVAGNMYALTAIDMLTNFMWCKPIPDKTASTVAVTYLCEIFAEFRGSCRILTDNGTEFKNAVFTHITQELGVKHVRSSPYHPQGNR